MRIAVTGGAGFIGSRLVRRLAEEGHSVVSIDLVDQEAAPATEHRSADVTDLGSIREALVRVDAVYHLAGFVLDGMQSDPYRGFVVNGLGTLNTLEACRLNGVGRFLFASSFKLYEGLPAGSNVDETTCLNSAGIGIFGTSKLVGESLAWEWARRYHLGVTVLRLGSAFGPGRSSNAVGTFVRAAQAGQEIEVWGVALRVNQYTYVDDIAAGLVLALDHSGQTINLVSPETTTVRELLAMLEEHLQMRVVFRTDKKEGPNLPYISSKHAQEVLGWRPLSFRRALAAYLQTMPPTAHADPRVAARVV